MEALVQQARDFAFAAHNAIDHRRKYTDEPYTTHLQRVADLVASVTDDACMIAAAYLHDTVEDTDTRIEDIHLHFGEEVAYLVKHLSDVSRPEDGNRAIRKEIDRQHIACGDARVHTIKLADLIDNSESIQTFDPGFAKVYMHEKRKLLTVLDDGDVRLLARAQAIVGDWLASA
ncbi:MAG: HD domain-containing protein [Pseudomonadales bacterium]|jgi:(p)ppGpp synthase/HD superfamily hydrolase|nr:HD domain-containing protein [Pseudomonadales bacterium]